MAGQADSSGPDPSAGGERWCSLHEKGTIESFLRRDLPLHLYELGDLEEPFWSHTTWYGLERGGSLEALALLYTGLPLPTLLALDRPGRTEALSSLVRAMGPALPARFYAHLAVGLSDGMGGGYHVETRGIHQKMVLERPERLDAVGAVAEVVPLAPCHAPALQSLYAEAYPGSWFHPSALSTGPYMGVMEGRQIVAAAGVHVLSPHYRVAAIGNLAVHPDRRCQGLGSMVTAALCRHLLARVDHVGLNVHGRNDAAIHIYEKLGFSIVAPYEECLVTVAVPVGSSWPPKRLLGHAVGGLTTVT